MDFTNSMVPVIVLGCSIIGYVLKKWITDVENKYIPTVLAITGALMNLVISGIGVESLIYGALSGLAATGLHQAFKNTIEKKEE